MSFLHRFRAILGSQKEIFLTNVSGDDFHVFESVLGTNVWYIFNFKTDKMRKMVVSETSVLLKGN